jgi:hypothetical protein
VSPCHQQVPCLPQGPLKDEGGAYSKYSCLRGWSPGSHLDCPLFHTQCGNLGAETC